MRKLFILIIFALVATATYLWFAPDPADDAMQAEREILPDYIAEDVTQLIFDEQGQLTEQIKAERLEHFEQLGFTQFELPVYTLFNQNIQPAWQATSLYGIWFPEDKVVLEQNVKITNLQPDDLVQWIETDMLEMLFPDNSLQTSHPVYVQGNGFYIKGSGLQADLTEKTLQLLQHQETVYLNEN